MHIGDTVLSEAATTHMHAAWLYAGAGKWLSAHREAEIAKMLFPDSEDQQDVQELIWDIEREMFRLGRSAVRCGEAISPLRREGGSHD